MAKATLTRQNISIAGSTKHLSYATPALGKGLDILELLARHPTGMTKSQMARELNRTVSEVFRIAPVPGTARLDRPASCRGTSLPALRPNRCG